MKRGQRTPFGGFRKRTYRLGEAGQDLVWVVRHLVRVALIWIAGTVDAATREAVMAAVAEVNGCKYCAYVHREWAAQSGLDTDSLGSAELPSQSRLAMACDYAQALAQTRFAGVPEDLAAALERSMSVGERADIEAITRVMTLVNVSVNTMEAFRSRLEGNPAVGSRIADEAVITTILVLFGLPSVVVVSLVLRRNPVVFIQEILKAASEGDTGERSEVA